jgi:hypothetical protein
MFEFSVAGAKQAAAAGQIDDWVDEFLRTSSGPNIPMADGLRKQRRWWIGPVALPLASMRRVCGPEPEMQYYTGPNAFERKVAAIRAVAVDPDALPPLILEYQRPLFRLCDGSHRHEALRRMGLERFWAFLWFNTEASYLNYVASAESREATDREDRPT